MPNLNKCHLMGNLTRDVELKFLPSNTPVASFGMAINRRWKNSQTGEQQEETTFVDLECFGPRAEVLSQYVGKGDPLFVEGRLKLDQWEDRDGNNRSKLRVVVENFEFLKGRDGGGQSAPQQQADTQPTGRPGYGYDSPAAHAVDDDDIPFNHDANPGFWT